MLDVITVNQQTENSSRGSLETDGSREERIEARATGIRQSSSRTRAPCLINVILVALVMAGEGRGRRGREKTDIHTKIKACKERERDAHPVRFGILGDGNLGLFHNTHTDE